MFDKVSKLYVLDKVIQSVQFDTEQISDVWVIRIIGRLDFEHHHQLRGEIDWLLENGKNKVLFNLNQVSAMSSSGAGAFVDLCHKLKKSGGQFGLTDLSKPSRYSLEILRLLHFFPIYDTETEAIAEMNKAD